MLERVRCLLTLLRRFRGGQEVSAVEGLRRLQDRLRRCPNSAIDFMSLVGPFLAVLNTSVLSEPFMIGAMEALKEILSNSAHFLDQDIAQLSDALTEIVDTLTSFRYVQTSYNEKDLVPYYKMEILLSVVTSGAREYLTNESFWTVGHTFYDTALESSVGGRTPRRDESLIHIAENSFYTCTRILLSFMPPAVDTGVGVGGDVTKVGLPCIMKVVGFLIAKLMKYSSPASKCSVRRSEVETRELLVVMKALKGLIRGDGDISHAQQTLLCCPSLSTMVRDELGKCMLFIAADRGFPQEVLEEVLSLFSTAIHVLGTSLKITVECFFQFIYLKALNQLHSMHVTLREVSDGDANTSDVENLKDLAEFSIGELEIVVESLSDILAEPDFVQSIFMSFDCDPTKRDILQQIYKYLSQNCSALMVIDDENCSLGYALGLAQRCYSLLLRKTSPAELPSENTSGLDTEALASLNGTDGSGGTGTQTGSTKTSTAKCADVCSYFQALYKGKRILFEASHLFSTKPASAFDYLIEEDVFQWPLQPTTVAAFLRMSPWIPKEDVGAFLGKLGDSKAAENSGKTEKFQQEVLSAYVRSFQFTGLTLVDCVRVFLSAFRLPGEAQQIDRILVQFSEYCHECCLESKGGILEHPDVAYVLCFAIIMLNTDLHNPNIRPERKMKVVDFVRNNTNYGKDANQTRPLPKEFLESIYESIKTNPIRTERNDDQGTLTVESWSDLQSEAAADSRRGWMISTAQALSELDSADETLVTSKAPTNDTFTGSMLSSTKLMSALLFGNGADVLLHPVHLSKLVSGHKSSVDNHIFDCTWRYTFAVAVSPLKSWSRFLEMEQTMDGHSTTEFEEGNTENPAVIRRTFEYIVELVRLSQAHKKTALLDVIMLVLADFAGALQMSSIDALYDSLIYHTNTFHIAGSDDETSTRHVECSARFLDRVTTSAAARSSLCTFLQIVKTNPTFLNKTWDVVVRVLGLLRDLSLLPSVIVTDLDEDLIPLGPREEFEKLVTPASLDEDSNAPKSPIPMKRSSSGSFFEALFGSSDTFEEQAPVLAKSYLNRWDDGYKRASIQSNGTTSHPSDLGGSDLKDMVEMCGVHTIVSDTKFLDESTLALFVRALVAATESSSGNESERNAASVPIQIEDNTLDRGIHEYAHTMPTISSSSKAWLEMLLVEIALRNRDRFAVVWPILSGHYTRTLAPRKDAQITIDYLTERRVVGLLRVASRMVSRRHLTAALVTLFGNVFVRGPGNCTLPFDKLKHFKPFASQISAGMWSMLTGNIAILPLLQLEEWQTLFDVLEIGSAAGGYASVKAFEALAFLLHEPRLRSEVPLFCIIAIKPILSANVTNSVSVGAVQLLVHLHSRLEVLIDSENSTSDGAEVEPQTPDALWESCWYPVLLALGDGIRGSKLSVTIACIDGISIAITDRHAEVVPIAVMTRILVQIVLPAAYEAARAYSKFRDEFIKVDMKSSSQGEVVMTSTDEFLSLQDSVNRFVSSLSETFIGFLPRLVAHPDVLHDLWLNVICALGGFLGGPHLTGKAREVPPDAKDIPERTIEAAALELNGLLTVAKQAKIFESLPTGQDLLSNTNTAIQGFPLFDRDQCIVDRSRNLT